MKYPQLEAQLIGEILAQFNMKRKRDQAIGRLEALFFIAQLQGKNPEIEYRYATEAAIQDFRDAVRFLPTESVSIIDPKNFSEEKGN